MALQTIIYPGDAFNSKVLIDILNVAYWPMFGELGVLGVINNEECGGENQPTCLDPLTGVTGFILLMIYMIVANVLLLNLLIALFRYKKNSFINCFLYIKPLFQL